MGIRINEDQSIVDAVREALKENGGYCPCRIEKAEDTKCICKDFRDKIKDPGFEGYCHCTLYYKSLED